MTDVSLWLERVGFAQYASVFAENDIDLSVLAELTEADLERLGVASLGHRRRLFRAIAKLNAQDEQPLPPVAGPTERRRLTVMFCDLVDATELSTRHDPEDLQVILADYHRTVQQAVAPFEGYVAQLLGDGVLVLFGYPRAREDGTVRAVQAALQVVRSIVALHATGAQLKTRIGIATGTAVIGTTGSGTPAEEVGVTGEVANLAARLQAAAPVMGVVISRATREQVGDVFDLAPLGALVLKGFEEPQTAWRVLGERPQTSRFEAQRLATLSEFVGRDGEFELLWERWELSCQGEGQTILISADAGMGKSRIVQALRERIDAQDAQVVMLQCSPYHQDSPLFPVRSWLERVAGILSEDDSTERLVKLRRSPLMHDVGSVGQPARFLEGLVTSEALLPDLPHLPPTELRRLVRSTLIDVCRRLSVRRPLLLLVEDAHWIDPTTEEFIRDITHASRDAAVLTLLTCRPEYQAPWLTTSSATRLTLNRLGKGACAKLAIAVAQKKLPNALLSEILAKTDGVPLFVEELTRTVLQSGEVVDAGDEWRLTGPVKSLSVPTTLQESLKARLDQLSDARELAQVCAAIGREFNVRIASRVLGISDNTTRTLLDQLEKSGLVVPSHERQDGVYTFRHALIRDVAYGSMIKTVRREYHARIATVLEATALNALTFRPEVLAYHHEESGNSSVAWPLWSSAGDLALRNGANAEAASHFASALGQIGAVEALDDPRLSIMLKRGEALQNSAGYAAAETTASMAEARELAARLGRLNDHMSAVLSAVPSTALASGRFRECLEVLEAFPESLLNELAEHLRVAYLLYLGIAYHHVGRLEDSWRTLNQSRVLNGHSSGIAHLFGGAHAVVPILSYSARNRFLVGDITHCRGLLDELWEVTSQHDHAPSRAWALQMRAWGELLADDPERAAATATELITLAQGIGLRTRIGVGKIHLGRSWILLGSVDRGIEEAREGLSLWRDAGGKFHCSEYAATIAASMILVGRPDQAIEFIEYGERIQDESDESFFAPELMRLRGCWLESQGDLVAARTAMESAVNGARLFNAETFKAAALRDLARLRRR